jgi:hypothetical protein
MLDLEYCSFTRVSSFTAFCLFTESFVRLVLLVLLVFVHRSLAYKYTPRALAADRQSLGVSLEVL